MSKFIVSRPINGITINGDEHLLDEYGNVMEFNTRLEAVDYLIECGCTQEEIESFSIDEETIS